MKKSALLLAFVLIVFAISADSFARGGFSSGGRGGFSSSSRPSSFSSSRSYSSSSTTRSYSSPSRTTVVNNHYGSAGYYGGYGHPMMMGGFGMGYGYTNGLVQGMILNQLMFPRGTTVYAGGGYQGNALLLPDGCVADGSGNQVGVYQNGQFTPMQGGMIAQPAPQPPVVVDDSPSAMNVIMGILIFIVLIVTLCVIF